MGSNVGGGVLPRYTLTIRLRRLAAATAGSDIAGGYSRGLPRNPPKKGVLGGYLPREK